MARQEIIVEAPELRLDAQRICERVDWREIFGRSGAVQIEIGIGKGRFMLTAAAALPEVDFLGIEWANKYLRFAEARSVRRGLKNVRFGRLDAKQLMPAIPDASVEAYYVFYPDPWPKRRHNKRRFLQAAMAAHLERTHTDGGLLHVITDHAKYWEAIEPLFDRHPAYERLPRFGGDSFPIEIDGPLTNYEAKYAVDGRPSYRGSWRRLPRLP